ncbi:MAG: hypothetical protein GY714_33115 [Desulfobacterales bacterium]|nr:hypothetical protein [Desulfobacterales bacterium]MCP4162697.1 hypothetical protein [Deltaproteobacteria bacterium]
MYVDIKPDFTSTASEFIKCIRFFGGSYNKWYIGLTNDAKHSFLNIHKLDMHNPGWILSNRCDLNTLRFVKQLLTEMGCKNSIELDMNEPDQIYLYKIRKCTRECIAFLSEERTAKV